jgi:hypothetical protein
MAAVLFSGCAAGRASDHGMTYDEGYHQGIRENLGRMAEDMNGNGFPYLGSNWSKPLVQEVKVPAHVQGGVFYPEHQELVIITPGEWKKAGVFPLHAEVRADPPAVEVLSSDITAMPRAE